MLRTEVGYGTYKKHRIGALVSNEHELNNRMMKPAFAYQFPMQGVSHNSRCRKMKHSLR